MRAGMSDIATKLKRIAVRPEMSQPDDTGEIDRYRATRKTFPKVGARVNLVVVNDLNAIPLANEYRETMTSPVHRYRWNAHEPMASPDSWRRWPTDPLAMFIVNTMTKVLPPFWWKVDGRDALAVAARIIDGHRDKTGHIDSDTRELVESIRLAVIDSA
jgi:hypothetical protein